MRLVKIGELPTYSQKEVIPSIRGVLTKVWPQNSGTASNGKPYYIQNLTIKDDTGEISIKMDGVEQELPQSFRNKEVVISCREGEKGLNGLKLFLDSYRLKDGESPVLKIKLTPAANIEIADPRRHDQPATPPPPAQQAPPQQSYQAPPAQPQSSQPASQPQQAPPVQPTNGNGNGNGKDARVNRIRHALLPIGEDYLEVLKMGGWIDDQLFATKNRRLSEAHFQAMTATLYISARDQGTFCS